MFGKDAFSNDFVIGGDIYWQRYLSLVELIRQTVFKIEGGPCSHFPTKSV